MMVGSGGIRAEELLAFQIKSTEEKLRYAPGFISANLHLSLDRTRLVNYAQWTNVEATVAARNDPEIVSLMQKQLEIAESFTPVPFKLVSSIPAKNR